MIHSGSDSWLLAFRHKGSRGIVWFLFLCLAGTGLWQWPHYQKAAAQTRPQFVLRPHEELDLTRAFEPRGILEMLAASRWTSPEATPHFATIVVNTTSDNVVSDDGVCSLREAIIAANTNASSGAGAGECAAGVAGMDTIQFALGAGTPTINLTSALPTITEPVNINGNTGGATLIQLNGAGAGAGADGLNITAGGSTVSRMVINRFGGSGIRLQGSSGNTVQNCYIGLDTTGMTAMANNVGVSIVSSSGNTLTGNAISGNTQSGVDITGATATGNQFISNSIGTDRFAISAVPNGTNGITISGAPGNIIGVAGSHNVISGNQQNGVAISNASGNQIVGNFIGVDTDGLGPIGNARHGVLITSSPNTVIGGTAADAANVISSNGQDGVQITGAASTGNLLQGNFIGVDGIGMSAVPNSQNGVTISGAPGNTVGGTAAGAGNVISGNVGHGVSIVLAAASGNQVQGNLIGTSSDGTAAIGNFFAGVNITGNNNSVGGTVAAARNIISGNGSDQSGGVLIGVGATGNQVLGNYIGTEVTGATALGNSLFGVRISSAATGNTIGGTTAAARNVISGNKSDGVQLQDPTTINNLVQGNYIGLNAAGTAAVPNSKNGVSLNNALNNTIGGTVAGAKNVISGNMLSGISFSNSSSGNLVQGNCIGTDAAGTAAVANGTSGIEITGVAASVNTNNTIGGTAAGAGNVIAFNTTAGISFPDLTESNNQNKILGNSIRSNGGLGIDLGGDGVTANDAGDPDTGANNLQNFPVLTSVTSTGTITGSLDSLAANSAYPVRIEFFGNTACDASGNGEGESFLGSTTVAAPGGFTASVTLAAGKNFITATATDNNGNTSEFSACRQVNSAPTITAAAPLTRQQGSAAINSQIATVSDADQALNTLIVSATPLTGAGVTITNILVSNTGQVTADVVASCTATNSTFTLKVTDNIGEMATATLTVNVTANAAPVLTYASPQNVLASQSLTVNPATGLSDNGTVPTVTVQSAGTYTGTISVNSAGVVSLSNARPAGSHLITIAATDNCGLTTTASFTLNVNCQTITVTPPATNTGTAGTAFNQTFTQTGGIGATTFSTTSPLPTGLTLASTGVLSGTPTQTGTFSITVKATDSNGCMGTANYTLTINCQTITVTVPSTNTGTVGTAFSQTFTQAGGIGATTFSTASTLPTGLTLASNGVLSGTPTQSGTFPITVKATDSNGCMGTANYTLTLSCPVITVSPASLPNATNGTNYSQTITAAGGTSAYTFAVTAGTLPTGLTLAAGGALSGAPSQSGTFNFTITATDANGCKGSRAYTIAVGCPPFPVTITEPSSVAAGQNFSYDVTIGSACPDVPLNTTLTTSTPANTTFQSITAPAGWSCTTPPAGSTGTITCNNASFSPNVATPARPRATATFTITLRVNAGTPIGTVITNNVTVTGTAPGVPTVTATGSGSSTVAAGQADLVLTKSGAATAVSGSTFNYTFNLTNLGPATADVVTFSDPLPQGTTFVSNTTPAGFTCTTPAANTNGTVTCTNPSMASGATVSFTITARLNANVACNTAINNTATVTMTTPDSNTTNNTSSVQTTAQTQSDLAVNVAAPATATPDVSTTYVVTVTNNGPSSSFNTSLNNALPAAFSAEVITPSTGSCTGVGTNTVNCNLGTLAAGATATVTIRAHVPETCQPTTAVDTATVTSGNCLTDPVAANNSQTKTTTVLLGNVGPGGCVPAQSAISADKPGSILFTGLALSGATAAGGDSNQNNTQMNITNIHPTLGVVVHLFFIDGATCSVADSFLCLTANQTTSFLMSDLDPGTTGYMMMVAVDGPPGFAGGHNTGCPISFNYIIGNARIKLTASPRRDADLAGEAVAAGFGSPLPACDPTQPFAELHFDGSPTGYNQLPRVLALDSVGSRADGNDTLLFLARIDGNWATGLQPIGPVFGLLYSDTEALASFSFNVGSCLFRSSISNNFPRVTPRFEQFIPAGRTGWMKLWAANEVALTGAALTRNDNAQTSASAFEGGHNLHILRLLPSATITIPVFPPSC